MVSSFCKVFKQRLLGEKLSRMVATFPAVIVSGARQVGKTTLVKHLFPRFDYFVFDPTIDLEGARNDPDLFLRNHPAPLFLDEIQYAPEVVGALKRRIDANGPRPGQYVVTGSQQWQVMAALSESLAGRAVFLDLEGFSLQEISGQGNATGWLARWLTDPDRFVVSRPPIDNRPMLWNWLWRGFMPGVQGVPEDLVPEFWDGYLRTYIERDARLGGDLRDWQQFGLFIRLVSALTAQELNYSQLGREIGITPQTAIRWLQILRGTFQWIEIPAYSGNIIKRVSHKPKGYLSDTGLACHLAQLMTPRSLGGHPLIGSLFETAMVHEVRKQESVLTGKSAFHHWRASSGAEVDLILEREGTLYPFEIKMTSNPGRREASGLSAFRESYANLKIGKGAILCAAERPYWITEDVAAIPWNVGC